MLHEQDLILWAAWGLYWVSTGVGTVVTFGTAGVVGTAVVFGIWATGVVGATSVGCACCTGLVGAGCGTKMQGLAGACSVVVVAS